MRLSILEVSSSGVLCFEEICWTGVRLLAGTLIGGGGAFGELFFGGGKFDIREPLLVAILVEGEMGAWGSDM